MAMVCLTDFEEYAKEHLSKATWDYYAAGADECCTRDDNLLAFKRIRLRPRILRDVSVCDTRTTVQGTEISFPVGIAPTAFHCLAWHEGEVATARATEAVNTCYITSTYSTCSVEEIVAAAPGGYRWFQLYVYRNRKVSEQIVHRVEALGYQALVLTVDVPYTGKRRNDIRNQFKLPPHLRVKNFDGVFEVAGRPSRVAENAGPEEYGVPANTLDPSISWKDIYWLQSLTRLPIIIKGILTKEDAELAVEHGVQGIIVSNHGGRQLDGDPATIDALSEIVDTVQGRIEVYLDGGIRTGSDVLKALALGAKCVFIGRPAVWGLAYKVRHVSHNPRSTAQPLLTLLSGHRRPAGCKHHGEEGVREVLQILNDEFRLCMALAGCRNVSEINRNLIQFSKL
ncbi:hydroxyacid oxidase 2-like [Scleropages formosus]|uniref:(S)-2-hydroxy-acid oxidase n=1 Tax=Scleropages formosus TaxID=113540 RepID=A0A0P7WCQ2_SCLFO|nr:hydroxyacid oxidase 2-like [Scleropages formosus]